MHTLIQSLKTVVETAASPAVMATDSPLGEGRIDNYIIDSSLHVVGGVAMLASMVVVAAHLTRLVLTRRTLDRTGRVLLAVAQVALAVQALLGIKLLDQGQGTGQLYIHYIGGLIPLGLFLGAGWFAWTNRVRHVQVMAALTLIGLASAGMAFTIGQAYVNRAL